MGERSIYPFRSTVSQTCSGSIISTLFRLSGQDDFVPESSFPMLRREMASKFWLWVSGTLGKGFYLCMGACESVCVHNCVSLREESKDVDPGFCLR